MSDNDSKPQTDNSNIFYVRKDETINIVIEYKML